MLTVTQGSAFPMPGMPKNYVQTAIDEIAGIMNEASEKLINSIRMYKPFLIAHGDGHALMEMLRRATSTNENGAA